MCVVAGFRVLVSDALPSALLLGCYERDALRCVGVANGFSGQRRVDLLAEMRPLVTDLAGHPWEQAVGDEDWVPLRPELVCEISYDEAEDGRLRHSARFVGWRPDTNPSACVVEQLTALTKSVA
jgi:ATP-dependent DNA ligase